MGIEIERKFLVANDRWQKNATGERTIRQFYLASSPTNSVRVRMTNGRAARLTIKSAYRGLERDEYEYDIPIGEAQEMIELRQSGIIEKTRYDVMVGEAHWEVDVFAGANDGLVLAEIEIETADAVVILPEWIDREVSGVTRYQNSSLASKSFAEWGNET